MDLETCRSQEEFKQRIAEHDELEELAYTRASAWAKASGIKTGNAQSIEFFVDGTYYVRYEEHWAYGGHDEYSVTIPLSMLWAPEQTIQAALDKIAEQNRLQKEFDESEKVRIAKQIASREEAEYKRLKKKFEEKDV
jgi:hypothetical protein